MDIDSLTELRAVFPTRGWQQRQAWLAHVKTPGLVKDLFPVVSIEDVYTPAIIALAKPVVVIQQRRIILRDLAGWWQIHQLARHTQAGDKFFTEDPRVDEIAATLGKIFTGKSRTVHDAARTLLAFGYILSTETVWDAGFGTGSNLAQAWRGVDTWARYLRSLVTEVAAVDMAKTLDLV